MTTRLILKPPICSECGTALTHDNMPKDVEGNPSNMRKCVKCGYITDIEAREIGDMIHTQIHLKGVDEMGYRYDVNKREWIR